MKLLMSLPWKGNVRELDNVIEHAMIIGDGEWITSAELPRALQAGRGARRPRRRRSARGAARLREGAHPVGAREGGAGQTARAELLGVSLSSLYRKIEELGIGLSPA